MLKHFPFKKILLVLLIIFVSFFLLHAESVLASGATITASPSTGSYGKPFDVSLVINGNGQAFNAAQATVQLSPNLSLQNLVLGDCNFSFLTTPSIANPSFAGILLGTSTKTCTAYTMTLAPIAKGNGTMSLFKGSVRRFGDAVNILSGMTGGTYTLTGAVPKSSLLAFPAIPQAKGNLYTVVLKVLSIDNNPVANTSVTMKSIELPNPLQAKTDSKGLVQFSNIASGIYETTVQNYKGNTILNVRGNNHTLVLGITVAPQSLLSTIVSNSLLLVGIVVLGAIVVVAIVIFFLRLRSRNR